MKKKIHYKKASLAIALILCAVAFFSWQIVFYEFSTDTSGYTITIDNAAETSPTQSPLWFSYSNTDITLQNTQTEVPTVYALGIDGAEKMTKADMVLMSEDYSGSFVAVLPAYKQTNRLIYASAKTDLQFTQGYMPVAPQLNIEEMPLEATFTNRDTLTLFFKGTALSDTKVTVTVAGESSRTETTDENGVLNGVSVSEVRKGVSISFQGADNNLYITSYQVENNTLFTRRFVAAMLPFLVIVTLSWLSIVICLRLRKRILAKDSKTDAFLHERGGSVTGERLILHSRFSFMTVRWAIMLLAFFVLVYGGRILGFWFSAISFPVFSCPINMDQLVGSSCFYLSHLDTLFELPWKEIAIFFLTFIVSTVVLGRMICGFLCPMGLLQDVVHGLRQLLGIEGVSLDEKAYSMLKPIKWAMVLLMLGLCLASVNFCDFCPAIALSPAFAGFRTSLYASGFMMVLVIVGGFFKRRLFCNVCPLGFLMGVLHKFSLFRLKKDCQSCTECGACYEACPMGIKEIYTGRDHEDITFADCIMCGECVRKCPEDNALAMSFLGIKFYKASRKKFMADYHKFACSGHRDKKRRNAE